MRTLLAVPVQLDALVLKEPAKVVGPLTDFRLLPWGDSTEPFLGKTIMREPFENETELPKGVHLHWTLPGVLSKAMGLPVVGRASFISAFGGAFPDSNGNIINRGADYWSELVDLGIITPLSNMPTMGRVIALADRAEKFRNSPDTLKANLVLINQLLDHATFPAAPTCWLVRGYYDDAPAPVFSRIIESDALFPADQIHDKNGNLLNANYTALPTEEDPFRYNPETHQFDPIQLFRFAGVSYLLDEWLKQDPTDPAREYLKNPLSATGAGDLAFAAFYPTCRSVFGYHDAAAPGACKTLRYEIVGWYREAELDYFRFYIRDFLAHQGTNEFPYLSLLNALTQEFAWEIPITVNTDLFPKNVLAELLHKEWIKWETVLKTAKICPNAFNDQPGNQLDIPFLDQETSLKTILDQTIEAVLGSPDALQMVCYASLTIDLSDYSTEQPQIEQVSIGNTGTEALSAYLASQMTSSPDGKSKVEEYLEAVQVFAQGTNHQLDINAQFAEARHAKGFRAETGGTTWSVRSVSAANTRADVKNRPDSLPLPESLALQLNDLNLFQQQFDSLQSRIQSTRQQIFADWGKYLSVVYFDDGAADYPPTSPDDIRTHYLEGLWMPELKDLLGQLNAAAGKVYNKRVEINQAVLNLQHLQPEEIKDWAAFYQALIKQAGPAVFQPISTLGESNTTQVIEALNQLIDQPDLYNILGQALQAFGKPIAAEGVALLSNQAQSWGPAQYMRYNRLLLQALFPQISPKANYVFQSKAAPRFWTPREPVLLLTGNAAQTSARFSPLGRPGQDQLLEVQFIDAGGEWKNQRPDSGQLTAVFEQIDAIGKKAPGFAFSTQTGPSWHPFMLQWMIDFYGPPNPDGPNYPPHFLTDHYELEPGKADFAPPPAGWISDDFPQPYMGYSLLSGHAGNKLTTGLTAYADELLVKLPMDDFYQANNTPKNSQNLDYLLRNNEKFLSWLVAQPGFTQLRNKQLKELSLEWIGQNADLFLAWSEDPAQTGSSAAANNKYIFDLLLAMSACLKLQATSCLSQTLGGLNAAMLMLRQIYQLPVIDPLENFSDLFPFINHTRDAVQNYNRFSPEPDNPFNPIRAGLVNLNQLCLVDTFGRQLPLSYVATASNPDLAPPMVAETLKASGPFHFSLPPRFVPPTRLNFRWLSANDDQIEMNDHPATSPICGWVLPNLLDNSLMIYEQDGSALGYIDASGQWQLFPGHLSPVLAEGIENDYLRNMVRWICEKAQGLPSPFSYMQELIGVIESALEKIEPVNATQHQGLAFLIGRPVALVRANLSLEGQGNTPLNQAWEYVRTDPDTGQYVPPTNFAFDRIKIPIRIGDDARFNDGFILCWEENGSKSGSEGPKDFYSLDGYLTSPLLPKAVADLPTSLSMLIDPRGQVHATSGVLPVKAIDIPPGQYAAALQKIEVAFLTTPVLTNRESRKISVPPEPGYSWTWTEKENPGWRTVSTVGHIQKKAFQQDFPSQAEKIWALLLDNNWIRNLQGDTAEVTPKDQRKAPDLGTDMQDIAPKIEAILDRSHLTPFQDGGAFSPQEIREGWLILKKAPLENNNHPLHLTKI